MSKRNVIVVLAVALCLAQGCTVVREIIIPGSGTVVEETRVVGAFAGINLTGSGEVVFTAGPHEPIRVSAEDNLLEYLKTEVRGDVLHLEIDTPTGTSISPTKPIRYFVSAPALRSVSITGSGDFTGDRVDGDALDLEIAGSGNVAIDAVEVGALTLDVSGSGNFAIVSARAGRVAGTVSGSGNLRLDGEAAQQEFRLAGAGNVYAGGLAGTRVQVSVAGSGSALVHATQTLEVEIAGSGSVHYRGTPTVSSSIQGSGEVSPAN